MQIGNTGQAVQPGSMGRPVPGCTVALVDPVSGEVGDEGEICLDLAARPTGLMVGYRCDDERTAEARRDGFHHPGDVGSRDDDDYITPCRARAGPAAAGGAKGVRDADRQARAGPGHPAGHPAVRQAEPRPVQARPAGEYRDEDFPELRGS